jgi:hypothetical protein
MTRQRTIRLTVVEDVDAGYVCWHAPKQKLDEYHLLMADALRLKFDVNGPQPLRLKATDTLDELNRRIETVAAQNRTKVTRTSKTEWFLTSRIVTRKRHRFPTPAGDGVKWGPSNFYPQVWRDLVTAIRSGLDFSTGWMGAKKEALSVRISRENGRFLFEVSTCLGADEDGEGGGLGKAAFSLHRKLPIDEIERRLDRAGFKAWAAAKEDLRRNLPEDSTIDPRDA